MSTPPQDEVIRPTVAERHAFLADAPRAVKAAAEAMILRFRQVRYTLPFSPEDTAWTDLADVALRAAYPEGPAGLSKDVLGRPRTSSDSEPFRLRVRLRGNGDVETSKAWLLLLAFYRVLEEDLGNGATVSIGPKLRAIMDEAWVALVDRGHLPAPQDQAGLEKYERLRFK